MYYLQVKYLTKSFWLKALLDKVDFSLSKWQKVALIAKNGSGKSTLFKLLQWVLQPDDGEIVFTSWISFDFLSQDFEGDLELLVSEYLISWANPKEEEREHMVRVNKMINTLNLKGLLNKQLKTCSGWELKRVQLAKILKYEPQFLLLDEPTNHLDIDMINRLEWYLSKSHMTLFMVTHDRYFLDRICTDIWELDKGKLHTYKGNYKDFLYKKSQREEREALQVHKLKQLYKTELDRIRRAPSGRQTKKRDRIEWFHTTKETYYQQKEMMSVQKKTIELQVSSQRLGNRVISIHKLCKRFWNNLIIDHFSYKLIAWERIGILGPNGAGKSTFMNILSWEESYDSGNIQWWPSVTIGYVHQTTSMGDTGMSILEYIKQHGDIMVVGEKRITASQLLEHFLFDKKQQQAKLFSVSWWERKRLQLCIALIKNPNVLILDEPTNDLDIETMTTLEHFLINFPWCILIISHDRYFLDKLVDHVFVFEGDGIIWDYWWNYTSYTQASKQERQTMKKNILNEEEQKESSLSQQINDNSLSTHPLIKKLSYHEQREFAQLGEEIARIDIQKESINTRFQQEQLTTEEIVALSKELNNLLIQSEKKEARWFELAERT